MPRVALTSIIVSTPLSAHVAGMNVYNTATAGDVTLGNYYSNGTKWIKVADEANVDHYNPVVATGDISTSSATDVAIPGMSISPPQVGTYAVMFNGQHSTPASPQATPFSTTQGCDDLVPIYNQLIGIPATNTTHALVFGNDETLTPGVYNVAGAVSILGTLTLDGGGNPSALFIINSSGAVGSGAAANNVFWIANGAVALGASTVMKGTLISYPTGAISIGLFFCAYFANRLCL